MFLTSLVVLQAQKNKCFFRQLMRNVYLQREKECEREGERDRKKNNA